MNSSPVELVLGTAQFGLDYGIAGRGEPVPADEVQAILAKAWEYGIRILDTAPVYGVIQSQLSDLMGDYNFSVVTKIPALPTDLTVESASAFLSSTVENMYQELGERIKTILFHNGADLLGSLGSCVWKTLLDEIQKKDIQLGVSCYSPEDALAIQSQFSIQAAQLPANAFDQRITNYPNFGASLDIYIRSVFLQGVLLMEPEQLAHKLPIATDAVKRWQIWCREHNLSLIQAALGVIKGFSGVKYCVFGVNCMKQLEEILEAWRSAPILQYLDIAIQNEQIIDPRRWWHRW